MSDFIREFIFPCGMLPGLRRFVDTALRGKRVACTSQAFGRDYAETLRRWRSAFEAQIETIRTQGFDEISVRA